MEGPPPPISKTDERKLIELIKVYPALYDTNHPHHNNGEYIALLWKDIAKQLNRTDEEIMTSWEHIFVRYMREKRKLLRRIVEEPDLIHRSDWDLYEILNSFLELLVPIRTKKRVTICLEDEVINPEGQEAAPPRPAANAAPRPARKPGVNASTNTKRVIIRPITNNAPRPATNAATNTLPPDLQDDADMIYEPVPTKRVRVIHPIDEVPLPNPRQKIPPCSHEDCQNHRNARYAQNPPQNPQQNPPPNQAQYSPQRPQFYIQNPQFYPQGPQFDQQYPDNERDQDVAFLNHILPNIRCMSPAGNLEFKYDVLQLIKTKYSQPLGPYINDGQISTVPYYINSNRRM